MKKRRALRIVLMVAMVFAVTVSCAFASTLSGSWKTTPKIKGHTYKYRSQMDYYTTWSPQQVAARGHVMVTSGSVGAGYIGIQARLYKSNGSLVRSSSWDFNENKCKGVSIPGSSIKTKGTYYSQCKFKFYKGNEYSGTYTAYKSPQAKTRSMNQNTTESGVYQVSFNQKGETYGSGLSEMFTGKTPTFVLADGDNGVKGYIKASDLDVSYTTTAEALQGSVPAGEVKNEKVPLYDENGKTIGTFTLVTTGGEELN